MATAKQTSKELQKLISDSVSKFSDGVESTQKGMYKRIVSVLKSLELDAGGNIKPNQKNIRLLRNLRGELRTVIINPSYLKKVDSYLNTFDQLKGINDTYYKNIASGFTSNKLLYKEIQKFSIDLTKTSLLDSGINEYIINPVDKILTQNITTGGSYDDMLESLRTDILGDSERLGRYERYSKQITTDALNQYNANYNLSVSEDLGLEFYFYAGQIKTTTRSYCLSRANKYFHVKEVKNEIPASWSGKIPDTNASNILINRGGYNCGHNYIAVLDTVVPQSVKSRAEQKGYYKPK